MGNTNGDTKESTQRDESGRKWYQISIRGLEVARYSIPDFFPDMNYSGPPPPLDNKKATDTTKDTYFWKRSVLAGVEASVRRPKKAMPSQEGADDEANADRASTADANEDSLFHTQTSSASRHTDAQTEDNTLHSSGGNRLLGAFTIFLFVFALFLTTSRALLPSEIPAIMDL
eukprot:CAMPEP_0198226272 /NCGR_PEP_ID=MMETSP1445-20131203/104690_1 /TAXON_ID=36898 /ORGANISM="Pyramimonas sp., Strain CCMP2087" /LENGTH=172 /DNA_ID=CAMNT_0043906051 /DNA_START=275 /DNA_END=793 /DNA_ORIENTATION=-